MALAAAKQHTNTGKTAGTNPAAPGDYDALNGTGNLLYTSDSGNIVLDASGIASGTNAMVQDNGDGTSFYWSLTFDFKFTGNPSVAGEVTETRSATAKFASTVANVSGGNPTFLARGGGDVPLTGWTAGVALARDVWYRSESTGWVDTASTGKMKSRVTRLSDSTVMASGESTTLNNGTTAAHHYLVGKVGSTGTLPIYIDNIAWWDGAGYAYIPAAHEVVNAGVDQTVEPNVTVTLTSSIAGTWVQDSGTTVTLAGSGLSRTFTAPTLVNQDVLGFTVTATDAGYTTSDSIAVTVLPVDLVYAHSDGTWHPILMTQ